MSDHKDRARVRRLLESDAFRRLQWGGDSDDDGPPEVTGDMIGDYVKALEAAVVPLAREPESPHG